MAGRIFNCREWKNPLSNENAAPLDRIPEEISLRDSSEIQKQQAYPKTQSLPLRPSAYLCVLCVKTICNAEGRRVSYHRSRNSRSVPYISSNDSAQNRIA